MTEQQPTDDGRGTGETGTAPVAASAEPSGAPTAPAAAQRVFGSRLGLAEQFAAILADTGVSARAHRTSGGPDPLGPAHPQLRRRPRGLPARDDGGRRGLGGRPPGLALAIARPDLQLQLVEPMLRRTTWLSATVEELGLDNCTVHRGRAEEFAGVLAAPYATARAVARIDKLARWTFPLLADGGTLVALKGGSAAEELAAEDAALRRLGMTSSSVVTYGAGLLPVATTTLQITVGARPTSGRAKKRRR